MNEIIIAYVNYDSRTRCFDSRKVATVVLRPCDLVLQRHRSAMGTSKIAPSLWQPRQMQANPPPLWGGLLAFAVAGRIDQGCPGGRLLCGCLFSDGRDASA